MSNTKIKILITIVNWNQRELLKKCLSSLITHLPLPYQIIVIDNGSSDGSLPMVRQEFPQVVTIENKENIGFARANNQALNFIREQQIKADYLVFFNNDAFLKDDSLVWLINYLDNNPEIVAVGPAVFFRNGLPQVGAAGYFPTLGTLFNYAFFLSYFAFPNSSPIFPGLFLHQIPYLKKQKPVEVDWISGVSLVTRFSIWEKVAGFPKDYFMYAEDIALCREIKKLGKIVYFPQAKVYHLKEGAATPGSKWLESLFYYLEQSGFSRSKLWLAQLILWLGYELRFWGYILRPQARRQKPYSFCVVREARLFLRRTLFR